MPPIRTTICAADKIGSYGTALYSHVISILDPDSPSLVWPKQLDVLPRLELRFYDSTSFTPEELLFSNHHLDELLAFADQIASYDNPALLIHCTQGRSRSPACAAIVHARVAPDTPGIAIFTDILKIRDIAWPALPIVELGDARLGRSGDLVAGAKAIYRYQLERQPSLGDELVRAGRAIEVTAAQEGEMIMSVTLQGGGT